MCRVQGRHVSGSGSSRVGFGVVFIVDFRGIHTIMQHHIFTTAEAKLQNIFHKKFHVALRLDLLIVDECAISGVKVDDVRTHSSTPALVCSRVLHSAVLQHSVLLGA